MDVLELLCVCMCMSVYAYLGYVYVYEWVRVCWRPRCSVYFLINDFFPLLLKYNRLFLLYIYFLRLVCSFDEKWKVPAPLLRHRVICDRRAPWKNVSMMNETRNYEVRIDELFS